MNEKAGGRYAAGVAKRAAGSTSGSPIRERKHRRRWLTKGFRGVRVTRNKPDCGVSMSRSVPLANDVFLPWGHHRTDRIADGRGPVSYYRIAEMAVALSCLTFALLGWREIVGEIWSALE